MQYTAIFLICKNGFFFIFAQNIYCGYTLEPPRQANQLLELYLNYENVHKVQAAQTSTPKHKTNATITEILPWNDQ